MENSIFIKGNMFGITSVFTSQVHLFWPDLTKLKLLFYILLM